MNIKKISLGLFIAVVAVFASCDSPTNASESNQEIKEHKHQDHNAIELNDGKKWKVVDEMLAYIRLMEKDVTDFQELENQQFSILAKNLQANVDLLTSNCTMTGKAHDELHKWLLPYIDLVDELAKAENEERAKATYTSIQSSFETFNVFFE